MNYLHSSEGPAHATVLLALQHACIGSFFERAEDDGGGGGVAGGGGGGGAGGVLLTQEDGGGRGRTLRQMRVRGNRQGVAAMIAKCIRGGRYHKVRGRCFGR